MNKKMYIQVNTDINAVEDILSWFEQINQPPISDNTIWWSLQTLLVEGFINIVEHAHNNLSLETPIDLEAIRFSHHIEIRIWSYGPVFDLAQQLQNSPELADNYEERGRGLKIMSQLVDKLSYEPTDDNRYCLFISKNY